MSTVTQKLARNNVIFSIFASNLHYLLASFILWIQPRETLQNFTGHLTSSEWTEWVMCASAVHAWKTGSFFVSFIIAVFRMNVDSVIAIQCQNCQKFVIIAVFAMETGPSMNYMQAHTQGGGGGSGGSNPPPPPPPPTFYYYFLFILFIFFIFIFLLVTPEVGLVDGRYPYPIM